LKIRLTGVGVAISLLDEYYQKLQFILKNIEVATEDIELEKVIGNILISRNQTCAFAESCTGGNIASIVTSISGASNYFKGGMIVYQNEIKINLLGVNPKTIDEFTEVSEQTALEMAINCRQKFASDYGLSITGYLEKNDHGNEVWIGLSSLHKSKAVKIIMPFDRQKNTVLASNTALNLLRIFILEN
jgi:nicotinamide-nucleotide amidase